jgi:hypothetical protein
MKVAPQAVQRQLAQLRGIATQIRKNTAYSPILIIEPILSFEQLHESAQTAP